MRWHLALYALAAATAVASTASCGDNGLGDGPPIMAAHDVAIVAHQDDDLLFMQPDQLDAVTSGVGVTTIYVTAGNGEHGADYAEDRYRGLRAAYSAATGFDDWHCGWIYIAQLPVQHCRLDAAQLSLIFIGYPDGGHDEPTPNALLHLWQGDITGADTVADRVAHYDRGTLIGVLASIIQATQPSTIRTLEVSATHGRDHEDHMIVGAIGVLAAAQSDSRAEIISYRGYNTESEPVNTLEAVYAPLEAVVAHYDACASGCAACGEACSSISDEHVTWLHRRYGVAMRRSAAGQLRLGDQCMKADTSGSLVMGDCADAPIWTFTPDHVLHVDTRCLSILPTGELTAGECGSGTVRSFFLDDEGHIYSGVAPLAAENMELAHLDCLVVGGGGRPHGALCGDQHATPARWQIGFPIVSSTRASLGVTGVGRAVRLGDVTDDGKADLCEVRGAAGLFCGTGSGDGHFAAMAHVGGAFDVEPESLAFGDVDGDGRPDACGNGSSGVVCLSAASHFLAPLQVAQGIVSTETASSLAVIDQRVCGFGSTGVTCALYTSQSEVLSTWPPASSVVAIGDLDGDGSPDWCAGTDAGPACALTAEQAITRDGSPAAFAQAGVIDAPASLDLATSGLADVDGDGRADLCYLTNASPTELRCLFGQPNKFGPSAAVATVDGATSLWLGDLDGDGLADLCTSDATSVSCVLAPARQSDP